MEETFCYDNFFPENEICVLEQAIERNCPGEEHHINHGPFAGKLIAEYVDLINDREASDLLYNRMNSLFDLPIYVGYFSRVKLYCPWDIHSDYYLNLCPHGQVPYYSLLIPLDDVPSRTIIFDQYTDSYTDFFSYKKEHDPVDNPPDEKFWEDNLSMCWPHDRPYVSVKKIMPWQKRGQIQGFHRKYFHSSDNFHTRFSDPKCFINVRLNIDASTITV